MQEHIVKSKHKEYELIKADRSQQSLHGQHKMALHKLQQKFLNLYKWVW